MSNGSAHMEKDIEAQQGAIGGNEHFPASSDGTTEALRPLRIYQGLVGIHTPDEILFSPKSATTVASSPGQPRRGQKARSLVETITLFLTNTRRNRGAYGRAVDEELSSSLWYSVSSSWISFVYILQIFVAATITGVSSYHGHDVPLTVLGAINTVLAGLLAFIKGQGLPNRMLRARDQFQAISRRIEDTERRFAYYAALPVETKMLLDPFKEADAITDMFNAAKKDQQDNYPDIYLNSHEQAVETSINENNRAMNAYLPQSKEDMAKRIQALEQQVNDATTATARAIAIAKQAHGVTTPSNNEQGVANTSDPNPTTHLSAHDAVTGS